MKDKHIDFKFAKNWAALLKWSNVANKNITVGWDIQCAKIQSLFEATAPNIVDWDTLWADFDKWYVETCAKKKVIQLLWSEQQRQIETLLILQERNCHKEIFALVYLYKGKPQIDSNVMTYWDALRTKQNLEGDKNGRGGDENMDKITIVNINNLIKV